MKQILVTGGAGYIGSHAVRLLIREGYGVTVLDNLSSGQRRAVDAKAYLVTGDIGDGALLDELFTARRFDAVMHFAGRIEAGESVRDPAAFYEVNVSRTLILLRALQRHGVRTVIFSSSAAVYGEPAYLPIDESHPISPVNPYGSSKRMVEQMLEDFHAAYGMRYGALRYFNAAGADPEGGIGECHEPETHLIPLVLRAAAGHLPQITIFGDDYDTADGSCIRDYVHVCDLARAHVLMLSYLESGGKSCALNLGSGRGYSVREVITETEAVTGCSIPVQVASRRAGDAAALVADGRKAAQLLGFTASMSDLRTVLAHAWAWEQSLRG